MFKEIFTKKLLNEDNVTKGSWESLKNFMKKQPGFKSFEVKDNILIINFKKNIQAIKAFQKSNNSYTEINAFGDAEAGDSKITVYLDDEAVNNL